MGRYDARTSIVLYRFNMFVSIYAVLGNCISSSDRYIFCGFWLSFERIVHVSIVIWRRTSKSLSSVFLIFSLGSISFARQFTFGQIPLCLCAHQWDIKIGWRIWSSFVPLFCNLKKMKCLCSFTLQLKEDEVPLFCNLKKLKFLHSEIWRRRNSFVPFFSNYFGCTGAWRFIFLYFVSAMSKHCSGTQTKRHLHI